MIFTVLWRRQSKAAAILSPILGLATGLAVWLSTANRFGGAVSVATTGEVLPCVYGTVASCFSPILYSVLITAVRPQNYDWNEFKREKLALEKLGSDLTTAHHETENPESDSHLQGGRVDDEEAAGERSAAVDAQELKRWGRIAAFWSAATFLGHWVLWPLPMYGSHYIFGKKVFPSIYPLLSLVKTRILLTWLVLYCLGRCCHHLALGHAVCGDAVPDFRRWVSADPAGVPGPSWAAAEDGDCEWEWERCPGGDVAVEWVG